MAAAEPLAPYGTIAVFAAAAGLPAGAIITIIAACVVPGTLLAVSVPLAIAVAVPLAVAVAVPISVAVPVAMTVAGPLVVALAVAGIGECSG
ncbi:MAG: hypothetical protein ABUL54_03940, partial [Dongia sp.]